MKRILALVAVSGFSIAAFAADMGEHACTFNFRNNSTKVPRLDLATCVKAAQAKFISVDSARVVTSATPTGSAAKNKKLSLKRANNVIASLKPMLSTATFTKESLGVVAANGLSARVILTGTLAASVAVVLPATLEKAPEPVVAPAPVEQLAAVNAAPIETITPVPTSGVNFRVAGRGGLDSLWSNNAERKELMAYGVDLAVIPQIAALPYLRTEIGAVGSAYDNKSLNEIGSAYGTAMLGVQSQPNGGFVAGVRGMAGSLFENKNDTFDRGGEVRLGAENDTWSAFAAGGRTTSFTRLGVDLGFKF